MNIRFADSHESFTVSKPKLRRPVVAAPITGHDPLTPRMLAGHLLHCGNLPLPVVARKVPAVHKMISHPRASAEQIMDDARFLRGDVDDTITHYLAALAIDEHQTRAARHLGHFLLAHDEIEAARACFTYIATHTPNDPYLSHAFLNVGEAYRENGQPRLAIPAYRQSLKFDPTQLDALEGLGLAQLEIKNEIFAILAFSDYLAIADDNASIWCNLGICWRNLNCLEAAEDAYLQSLRRDPKLVEARFNLCLVYLRLHKFGDLIGQFLILKKQAPELAKQLEPLIVSK